jgi:hypothetical protein
VGATPSLAASSRISAGPNNDMASKHTEPPGAASARANVLRGRSAPSG